MLDIKFIKKNISLIKRAASVKNVDLDIDYLLRLYDKKIVFIRNIEELRKERNKNTDLVKTLSNEKDRCRTIQEGKLLKKKLQKLEEGHRKISKEFQELMLLVPNIPSDDTPIGKDDQDNKEIYHWGDIPKFNFPIKSHLKLGEELDLIDIKVGTKVSGFRGYFLKNEAVLLHLAVLWYSLNKLIQKGFIPFLSPTLIREFALVGSGHFPAGKNEIYQIANPGKLASGEKISEPIFLVGTSEPSLLAYYSDRSLNERDLPIKICGISQCYRSEIGSYGKDTKGLFRLHEFMKVEQIIICKNDIKESNKYLEDLRLIAEEILQDVGLPYRVIQVCTGEMGAGKYKMYDIETWMPSRDAYAETHSDSNLTDWQARRLNIKYKTQSGDKEYVHTLNNTVIASPRILISLLECNQQADGSIRIPKVLRPYLNNKEFISKKK
jgi:seryl-tRNA synthetase